MKILFVTLSNIGDCILTLPVLDALRQKYPQAKITCLVPPRPQEIFNANPAVAEVIIFDKHAKLKEKVKLFFSLAGRNFDLVIDLRNSFFGAFLPTKKGYGFFGALRSIPKNIQHMKEKHLFWAGLLDYAKVINAGQSFNITSLDRNYISSILAENNFINPAKIIVVSPGSRSQLKCWDKENFKELCEQLIKDGYQIVLVGDAQDQPICDYLQFLCREGILNLCAKTSFGQLAALLQQTCLLITNDSALMHLSSYLNLPVVAVFGPTNEKKYGPWSQNCAIVKKDIFCRPCQKAYCRFGFRACLNSIKPADVLRQVRAVLTHKSSATEKKLSGPYQRILIVRTDRLGDVLLSTPVIKALRQELPQAYIAMLVAPYTREVLDGNPDLDEVITFDKDAVNKGVRAMFKFAQNLKNKKFDLAIVLHPTMRMHWLVYLTGIAKRLGYNRKCGFLLTDKIKHTKQFGEKHESEYALDLVRYLGIHPQDKTLYMPIKSEAKKWAQVLFAREQIKDQDKLLVIHPAASCPSKIWSAERFAQVADQLVQLYGFRVAIVSAPNDRQKAELVIKSMHRPVLNLAGKTSISQLASLLERAQLFISTDSGPMHVACAVGVPVITIFGRAQAGLSPLRWGPLGDKSRVLHKNVGCTTCLAHNCQKDFACLKATTVEDVLAAAASILKT